MVSEKWTTEVLCPSCFIVPLHKERELTLVPSFLSVVSPDTESGFLMWYQGSPLYQFSVMLDSKDWYTLISGKTGGAIPVDSRCINDIIKSMLQTNLVTSK